MGNLPSCEDRNVIDVSVFDLGFDRGFCIARRNFVLRVRFPQLFRVPL